MSSRPARWAFLQRSVVTLSIILGATSCSGPKRMLQMKVYPNDSFIVYETSDFEMSARRGDKAAKTSRGKSEIVYRFDVRSVDDSGTMDLDVEFQKVKYSRLLRPLGKALVGKSFSMRMEPDGRIASFGGTEALRAEVDEVLSAFFGSTNNEDLLSAPQAKLMVYLSDEALRGRFEVLFRLWPPTPVAPGDQWVRDSIGLPQDGLVDTAELTLTSWEGGEAVVSIRSTLQPADAEAESIMSGHVTSKAVLDAASGFPKHVSSQRYLEGTITHEGGGTLYVTTKRETFVELLRL